MPDDRCVLFLGDSFVAGVGDPTGRGWVGRVVEASFAAGLPLTAYNLGVRRETSLDVEARWLAELRPRALDAVVPGVAVGFGTNDTTEEDGRVRVAPGLAVDAFGRVIDVAAQRGMPVFVVGPPPSGEPAQDRRVHALSARLAEVAAQRGVPFADVAGPLCASAAWTGEAVAGDGSHPGARGYEALAQLVLAAGWLDWLAGLQAA